MAESASGEDEASVGYPNGLNPLILPAEISSVGPAGESSFWPYDLFLIDQACSVLMAVYWPFSFLRWRFHWLQLRLVP